MALILDGSLGITTPAETVQGALTTTGNTILGDASTDTLNVGNGGLVKDASGNVGIGTAAGTTTVSNGLAINNATASNFPGLEIQTAGVTRMFFNANNAAAYLSTVGTIPMVFYGNSTERMRIDSSGNLLFNSGYGSAATAYGCRAWVNFNGTGTVAIRASGNVSSITDNAAGDYTVNFTTAMVDVNYAVNASAGTNTLTTPTAFGYFKLNFSPLTNGYVAPTTSTVNIGMIDSGSYDVYHACVSIFR